GPAFLLSLAHPEGGDQGTDTDSRGSQVVDLVDLQAGVNLAGVCQDIADLIGGDGVQAAAEGIQLDDVQVIPGSCVACGCVHSGMVHPLVHDEQRTLHTVQVADGSLGQHGDTVGIDQLRNTMVDFRV